MTDADGKAVEGIPGKGPYMQIWVKVGEDRVIASSFKTYGCAPAIAAGSFLCEWAIGKSIEESLALTEDTLSSMLGGVPEHKRHCSILAVKAFCAAVTQAATKKIAVEDDETIGFTAQEQLLCCQMEEQ